MDGEQAGTKTKTIRRDDVPPHERSFRSSAASAVAVVDAADGRAADFCRGLLAFLCVSAAACLRLFFHATSAGTRSTLSADSMVLSAFVASRKSVWAAWMFPIFLSGWKHIQRKCFTFLSSFFSRSADGSNPADPLLDRSARRISTARAMQSFRSCAACIR